MSDFSVLVYYMFVTVYDVIEHLEIEKNMDKLFGVDNWIERHLYE